MKQPINFLVSYEDGFYTADSINVPVVTQGETLDELLKNIKEAVDLHNEGESIRSPFFTLVYSDYAKAF
jgi:predicted RNase H-like HicB family nuclease